MPLDRECTALARVDDGKTLGEQTAVIEERARWHGRSVRALHPFAAADLALLQAVNRGEFRSAAISRKLRFLRAHGIIHKLPNTHRFRLV